MHLDRFETLLNVESGCPLQAVHAYNAGMNGRQYTIRSVPDRVDRELRSRANSEGKSLNALLLAVLEGAVTPPDEPVVHHDLDFLIGTWVEDPEFDKAMEHCERINAEDWK